MRLSGCGWRQSLINSWASGLTLVRFGYLKLVCFDQNKTSSRVGSLFNASVSFIDRLACEWRDFDEHAVDGGTERPDLAGRLMGSFGYYLWAEVIGCAIHAVRNSLAVMAGQAKIGQLDFSRMS